MPAKRLQFCIILQFFLQRRGKQLNAAQRVSDLMGNSNGQLSDVLRVYPMSPSHLAIDRCSA
jgi:hypothetical protein